MILMILPLIYLKLLLSPHNLYILKFFFIIITYIVVYKIKIVLITQIIRLNAMFGMVN